ncbi:MAG: bifunctional phosphopantothenoylcysteine decarboxylase/phosphopantothenate--cysteine ligase CoaBC [Desulfobacterales bacterium]|nr:bifunctional phosphopantothenoylcysteine decarboxylase/phosphopantothenate--cysteine ligase CoaBC [Desulfobacterales bacterium]
MMRNGIKNKKVILAVCGGIAAYKSIEILRLLKKAGAEVRVIMTQSAQWFVGALTFEALSGQSVFKDMFQEGSEASFRHIDWAREADGVIIAPATANTIGKLANGIADDPLSTFMLAVASPVLICPSMNTHMYANQAVQRNLDTLRSDGYVVVEPASGQLACGTTGPGRLPEPEEIFDRFLGCLSPKDLVGKKILVTAGPTIEPIDPVRFISNRSSGKMGFAVARAAEHRGAEVTLISGPTHLADPMNVTTIRVRTAEEMAGHVFQQMENADVIIKSAAVSDYGPKESEAHKIKKGKNELVLHLQQNEDILKVLGQKKKHQILVGFAAETKDLEKNATQKLAEKNLDIIAGNLVGSSDSGFESDTNTVTLFFKDGTTESLPTMEKLEVAHILLDRIATKVLSAAKAPKSTKN